ncbi:hypothetical protein HP439_14170 [Sphingobacterium shayense]|uniref:hypothetical protein n=1 Tax=Sphingobacterium shayense TaxID=626343 RepID=UPI00155630A7|nr:hypothetical protein [Sphingobacterium shayense]NQD71869.1 hypothetical protein [Sphingobacterium shayense]
MKIRYLLLIISIITTTKCLSQIIDDEQSHPSIDWKQIDTEDYQLIFPADIQNAARELASELSYFLSNNNRYFHIRSKKTPIILQGNHIAQNGFVQLAPRKSELFPVPSSTPDNQSWLSNLAIHELRHVAQFDKMSGKMGEPFFEQLAFALYGLNLPAWYFEGDAVHSETLNSKGGRGRLPSWEMPLRANLLSGKAYNFNKYVLGSFKDNIPSYYTIGYFINGYISNHFGVNSTNEILSHMHGNLVRPFNFRRALRAQTGETASSIFQKVSVELNEKWEREAPLLDMYSQPVTTPISKYPSDYLMPQVCDNGAIYALYRSPESVNKIVRLHRDRPQEILKTGIQITPHFNIRGQEIVWDEYRKDPRFGKQTYSVINLYNIKEKTGKTLTTHSRYYAPSLHPTLNKIVAVEVTNELKSRIIILDSKSGIVIDSIPPISDTHLQQPRYDETGDRIVAIAVSEKGTNLIQFNITDKQHEYLLAWGNQQIERPFYKENSIVFKAHFDGIDNIYSRSEAGKLTKLTNALYGAFNASVDKKGNLLYNDYQVNGYKIAKKPFDSLYSEEPIARTFYLEPTIKQLRDSINSFRDSKGESFLIDDYNPSKHVVNFHSLSISSTNFENFDNYIPGIFWLSNDVLNTTQTKLGYEYDPETRKSRYSAELSYRKYLPMVTIRYANRGLIGNAVSDANPEKTIMYEYRDNHISLDIALPFSTYRQNVVYSYGANFGTSYTNRYDVSTTLKNFSENIAFPLNYQLYFNRNSMRSKMDIAPKWGQNFSVTYRHLPFEKAVSGQIFSARTSFYFPGLFANHSIQIRAALQEGKERYEGVYDIPMVSGWGYFESPIVTNTASINYRLPLFYPDWSIGSTAYIKRFQGFLFSDFQNMDSDLNPKSFGVGISADMNVFRYVLPDINIGTKLTYINDKTASKKVVPSFSVSYSY